MPFKKITNKNKSAITYELSLAFVFSPGRQPLVHAVLQVVKDIGRLRTKSFFSKAVKCTLDLKHGSSHSPRKKTGSEVLVHRTKRQTCLGDSGEQRREAGLWLRPWETFHCSTKKRDGFLLGSRGEGRNVEKGGKLDCHKNKNKNKIKNNPCIKNPMLGDHLRWPVGFAFKPGDEALGPLLYARYVYGPGVCQLQWDPLLPMKLY